MVVPPWAFFGVRTHDELKYEFIVATALKWKSRRVREQSLRYKVVEVSWWELYFKTYATVFECW